jgi:phosphatidate cytidylyltransferase
MTRVLSGVALAAATLAAIRFLPFEALRALACAIAALAADEYVRVAAGGRSLVGWLVVGGVVYTAWRVAVPVPVNVVWLSLAVVAWLAFVVLRQGRTLHEAAAGVVAPMYIGAPLGMLVALHGRAGWKGTLVLLATVVVSDSAQYYTGRAFGRRPLAPSISPKKTIEGALGGVIVGALFMAYAVQFVFPATPAVTRLLLGVVVVLFGIVGDLFESRLKRLAGLKDSSSLIPGHGGVLDRIDAMLFAIPVFYLMVVQGRLA